MLVARLTRQRSRHVVREYATLRRRQFYRRERPKKKVGCSLVSKTVKKKQRIAKSGKKLKPWALRPAELFYIIFLTDKFFLTFKSGM